MNTDNRSHRLGIADEGVFHIQETDFRNERISTKSLGTGLPQYEMYSVGRGSDEMTIVLRMASQYLVNSFSCFRWRLDFCWVAVILLMSRIGPHGIAGSTSCNCEYIESI